MSSSALSSPISSADDGVMDDSSSPRSGGPSRRRSFTPAQKLDHLAAYEAACERSEGGAYLRRELADRERRLATTETALEIMGKAHALLEQISESAETDRPERPRRKR